MHSPRVYGFDGLVPVVDPSSFIHPSAILIGDVIVGPSCYIGPCAVLRGDFGRIVVAAGVNIQDCCVLHSLPERDMVVSRNGHVGHGAVLHGCRVGEDSLIGMKAVVMDGAEIGRSAIVAACAFIKTGMTVPPRSLFAGVPARFVRTLSEDEIQRQVRDTHSYQVLADVSRKTMRECDALTEVEARRPSLSWTHAVF